MVLSQFQLSPSPLAGASHLASWSGCGRRLPPQATHAGFRQKHVTCAADAARPLPQRDREFKPRHDKLDFRFIFGYSADESAATLRAIAEREYDVTPLLSVVVARSGVPDAFDDLSKGGDCIKLLVDPSRV